jgi:hypothetical protein
MLERILDILERAVVAYEKEVEWRRAPGTGFPFSEEPEQKSIEQAVVVSPPETGTPIADDTPGLAPSVAANPNPTAEDIRGALIALVHAKGRETAEALLKGFGAESVSALDPSKYSDFLVRAVEVADAA